MSDAPAPGASVIIPNWNGLALLRPCLNSLAAQTLSPLDGSSEVIVVDNGSRDGSVDAVQAEYPGTRAWPEREPGVRRGCNAGIAVAQGEIW